MKPTLVPGSTGCVIQRVVTEHLVSHHHPGAPPVLASPWLLTFMERAAHDALAPHLEPHEHSVGVGFNFQHLAPTPAGHVVTATAEVVAIDGRSIRFRIEARDQSELVATGEHVRAVIHVKLFGRKLRAKQLP